jgi:hypothetical protein
MTNEAKVGTPSSEFSRPELGKHSFDAIVDLKKRLVDSPSYTKAVASAYLGRGRYTYRDNEEIGGINHGVGFNLEGINYWMFSKEIEYSIPDGGVGWEKDKKAVKSRLEISRYSVSESSSAIVVRSLDVN